MVRMIMVAMLFVAMCTATVWAQDISGNYKVTVKGVNVMMKRSSAHQHFSDETTLKVSQNGDRVTMTFGSFGGVSAATIFKGKVGNNRFSAVWWYQGYSHETKVIWGRVRNNKLSGQMIFPRVAYKPGMVSGWVEIDFEAVKTLRAMPIQPAPIPHRHTGPIVHAPGEPVILKEDCLGFDPGRLQLKAERGRYLLTDGRSRMKMFPNHREARRALKTIRHYNMDQHCFVGRPDPSMEYWSANGQAPSGRIGEEDCISFNFRRLRIEREGSQWLMTDGRSRMRMFPNRREAEKALRIIRKYGFNKTCYIGRPDPSMVYYKK